MSRLMPRCGVIALAIVAMSTWVHPARAGFPTPSPVNSTLPPCIVACPSGDLATEVIVRDWTNLEIGNAVVTLDFCSCSGARFCPPEPSDGYLFTSPCQVAAVTSTAAPPEWGKATIRLRGGGSCSGLVTIYADGVLLGTRRYASTDQNGDLTVSAADATALATKLGTADLSGDLDCDAQVSSADASLLNAHLGHTCPAVTQARRTNWGQLKIRYR